MTKSVDEALAPVCTLDNEAFPVPDETSLNDRVHSAEEEGAIQVQVEIAATLLGKVGAGVARAISVPANGVVDALGLGLDGAKPVRERLFVQCCQSTDGGSKPVIADFVSPWLELCRRQSAPGFYVKPNLFTVLGVPQCATHFAGRILREDEGRLGNNTVVVLSEGFWTR